MNTIEENIFKKSLQKRELGGLIIEGNFDVEFFQKVNMRDLLEVQHEVTKETVKRNLFKEENIVFHHLDQGAHDLVKQQGKEGGEDDQ